ncbi:MAG: type II secretion system protein GspC [Gammaproteobacteria bacterium]|nr:type II secretion system protein GspC [Gammaproteobacteria bacterium]MBU2677832.1 type II secretion system protein GspC [Gammaproteobacteria bacterium]NNC57714.1 type II secretion system protein GspC [Woeseiaceae bacterium]NNL51565.1 type II secretion system protein GspC [Woeseiaceae bacterium]
MTTKATWSDLSSIDSSNALSAINRLLPPWVALLLVVAIAWQIAKIIWMLVPGPAAGDNVPVTASLPTASIQASTANDVQAIVNAHMFGLADVEPVDTTPVQTADENLSDTRLTNLSLKGTVASDIAEFSVAIIADGNNEEKVYAIGDPIGSSAKLHAVYSDRVVLNENGVLTNLKLPKEFSAGQATPTRRTTRSIRETANDARSIQAVVSQNLTKLSDVIRPTPYFVNGQQSGYRVYPGRDRQQFSALGLRPGDLIKDIDGQSLTDPTQAMQIFQALGTSEQVTVTVERNGQPQTIVLKTSQLDLGGEQTK